MVTAIDTRWFTSTDASCYHSLWTEKTRTRFLKVSLAVDATQQVILAAAMTRYPIPDVWMARSLLTLSHRTRKAASYVPDKRYGAEFIHRRIQEAIQVKPRIPARNRERKRIRGRYRMELVRIFDEKTYHRRDRVETAFFGLKRITGESLKARTYRLQAIDLKLKTSIYNLKRTLALCPSHIMVNNFSRASIYGLQERFD
ncbi:MAG: hypothetical protein QMD46_07050 [Methanomicrobiales archaeon]|nr:hypothetical protein [Methanomicrobiales archaeon]MDI6876494.1 hypothetical protein [Methanomicrobiales archaeon]